MSVVPAPRKEFSDRMMQLISTLRLFLRDFPELNRLIEGYESSDRFLAWAIIDALDDINNTPPHLGNWTPANFPYASLLIRKAAVTALQSVGILTTRNHLPYSDGGLQADVSGRTPTLMNWIRLFEAQADRKLQRWKIAKNIDGAWGGGVHSDYWYLYGYYGA